MSAPWLVLSVAALASGRPTEPSALYSFDPDDEVVFHDLDVQGAVPLRVHYSVRGPQAVADPEADPPALVQGVGEAALHALDVFDASGFLPPPSEPELGLGELGGSGALDTYLVDFGGGADGRFVVDGCDLSGAPCAGHLVVENDFVGYGYASLDEALQVVVTHELFHAVQAAYTRDLPTWVSEGTATWAQRHAHPDDQDFLRFADLYLAQAGRSLDRPPAGPVQGFSYGTGLWFDHLSKRHGASWVEAFLAALTHDAEDATGTMAAMIEAHGDSLQAAWTDFALANLRTGSRAGPQAPHRGASSLVGPPVSSEGSSLEVTLRVFPLSARYDRVVPAPEQLRVHLTEPDPSVRVSLVVEGEDGVVAEPLGTWPAPDVPAEVPVPEEAQAVWVVTSHGGLDGEAMKGSLEAGPSAEALVEDGAAARGSSPPTGCATSAGTGLSSWWLGLGMLWLGLWWRGRATSGPRRRPDPQSR